MAEENNQAEGIVSVNSRGGTSNNNAGKMIFFFLVVAVLVIGALVAINTWRDSMAEDVAAEMASKNENKPAAVGQRRVFSTDPPVLRDPEPAPAPKPRRVQIDGLCSDGSLGTPIRGPNGETIPGVDGKVARVCPDGRLVVPAAAPAQPKPIPVQQTAPAGPAKEGPSRYGGGLFVKSANSTLAAGQGNQSPQDRAVHQMAQLTRALTGGGAGAGGSSVDLSSATAGLAGSRRGGSDSEEGPNARGPIGNLLQGATTSAASASTLSDRSLILPKGRSIPCALTVRVISEVSGMTTCTITQNIYSDNGRVVLLERGSEAVGEYSAGMKNGQRRLFVLWTRVKTPNGVIVNLESPGADALGTSGQPGFVDNRWVDRIGAAFMLSVINDAFAIAQAKEAGNTTGQTNIQLGNTQQTGQDIAEKVLESTINIPPTLYANQGDRASIFVARDLDFGEVYALRSR